MKSGQFTLSGSEQICFLKVSEWKCFIPIPKCVAASICSERTRALLNSKIKLKSPPCRFYYVYINATARSSSQFMSEIDEQSATYVYIVAYIRACSYSLLAVDGY